MAKGVEKKNTLKFNIDVIIFGVALFVLTMAWVALLIYFIIPALIVIGLLMLCFGMLYPSALEWEVKYGNKRAKRR